jgi:poly(A) polymerase
LRAETGSDKGISELGYRHDAATALDVALLRAALSGMPLAADTSRLAARGAAAVLPVKAVDLMPALQGQALGSRLRDIESRWIASGFTLTREQLLS